MRGSPIQPSEWGTDELGDLWLRPADQARLTNGDQRRVVVAIGDHEGPRDELTYLLRELRTNLSGLFLREFVDRLVNGLKRPRAGEAIAIEPAGPGGRAGADVANRDLG